MAYKKQLDKTYRFTNNNIDYCIHCYYQNTSYGFRHLAELEDNTTLGVLATSKACYYNRTWESYEYKTVINKVIDNYFNEEERGEIKRTIEEEATDRINKDFNFMGAMLAMTDLIQDTPKAKNASKVRLLRARYGDAFILPDNWGELPEEEKTKRLNKIEKLLLN